MALRKDPPKDEVCINGRFVYTNKQKPLGDGHTKTDAYVDNRGILDARFDWKVSARKSEQILLPHHPSYRVKEFPYQL